MRRAIPRRPSSGLPCCSRGNHIGAVPPAAAEGLKQRGRVGIAARARLYKIDDGLLVGLLRVEQGQIADGAEAQRVEHLGKREPVIDEPALVGGDLVGLALAASARDVDDARHGLETAPQDPVLEGLEVGDRIAGGATTR
jgi:hypothetical protein